MTREEEKYTTLDTEQCKWWVNTLFNVAKEKAFNSHNYDDAEEIQSAQDKILNTLEQEPSGETVSLGAFKQIMWERDVAIEQLKKLGYGLGEKPKSGHWIKYDNEYFADGRLTRVTCSIRECSACHAKIADFCGKMYYCPYCGEPKESEEV